MFSCLLLHAGSGTEPLVAQRSEVSVQAVGHVGNGTASFHYELDKDYKGLLLYVPSLIDHRDATRQRVRLCGCTVRVQRQGETQEHSFRLASFESSGEKQHNPPSVELSEQASLKSRYKDLVASFSGAHSHEDVLFRLDDAASGSLLSIDCEFMVQFSPASVRSADSSCSSLEYRILNKLSTKHLSYSLNLASSLRVEQVSSLFPDTPTVAGDKLQWTYMSELNQNVVHVEYEHQTGALQNNGVLNQSLSSGFAIALSKGIAAAICTGLPPLNTSFSREDSSVPYDGILMVDDTFTREQLPAHLQQKTLFPSEFVFVIDCSGSMSGTNIQSAADTLITCVKSLPVGCYFNVVAFGSTFRQLFHSSEPYSKKSADRALQFANQLQASLGGTELLAPLKWVFRRSRCAGLPRQIFIVTDGGVANTQAVLHTVRKYRQQARWVFVSERLTPHILTIIIESGVLEQQTTGLHPCTVSIHKMMHTFLS